MPHEKQCAPGGVRAPHGGYNSERLGGSHLLNNRFGAIHEIHSAYADCREFVRDELVHLEKLGAPPDALAFNAPHRFEILTASIVRLPPGRFEFARYHRGDEKPVNAAIILCRNELGDIADIAAWVMTTDEVRLWLGRIAMLGEENALAPRLMQALAVYASPLEWIADYRRGVVVIEPVLARPVLYSASPIAVASIEFGQWLRSAMAAPLPGILVLKSSHGGRS